MDKKKRKRGGFKKFLLALLTIIIIGGVFTVSYGYYMLHRISTSGEEHKNISPEKPFNLLVMGLDAGDYESKSKNTPKRSDTMMLFRYNPKNGRINILSIPRDTKIKYNHESMKLNALHAIGGKDLTISSIEDMLGIKINYYTEIDYAGFRECIDSIGGVDMVIPRDMDYDAWKIHVHFKKGELVHLDGKKAEEFVRWRKNNDGTGYALGDIGRISTQQEFMITLINKLKSPAGIIKLPDLMNTLSKYVKTNMSPGNMLSYAMTLGKIKKENIVKNILEGEPKYINGASFFVWDKEKNKSYLEAFKGNDSITSDSDTSSDSIDTLSSDDTQKSVSTSSVEKDAGDVKVAIYNSTGKAGLAALYKEKLEKKGYKVIATGNFSRKLKRTIIRDYTSNGVGNKISSDINLGKILLKKSENPKEDAVIILGMDTEE